MEGNRRETRSEAGSQRHKHGEWNFNPEQSFQKSRWMSFEIVLTSHMRFQVNMVYFRGFGENHTIAGPILICMLLLEMLFLTLSACLGYILDFREFLEFTSLGITYVV